MTFVDGASRKAFVYFLEFRSQVKEVYEKFKTKVETTVSKMKIRRTDNGTEFQVSSETV